jgi:hypothetical protein
MPGLTSAPRAPRPAGARWRPDGWDLGFAAAVLAQVGMVLALAHVPTVDGPAHLAGARVLGDWQFPLYRRYYTIDLFPSPNLLTGLVLAGLVRLFSPATADRLLAAGYLVLFPVSLRYALTGVCRSARWLAFLAFPLSLGYLFWYGFTNYCYGVALALFVVGYDLRHRGRWTPRTTVGLGVLLLATYATHLVPFGCALLFVAISAGAVAWENGIDRGRRRALLAPTLAALPSLALTAAFLLRGGAHSAPTWRPLPELVGGLVSLGMPVVTFERTELAASIATALVLLGTGLLGVRRHRSRPRVPGAGVLAAATIAVTLLYLGAPNKFGLEYGLINARISVFPGLFVALWLATRPVGRWWRPAGAAVFLLAAFALALMRAPDVIRYDGQLREYATAARVVTPGSTLVALRVRLDSPLRGPVRVASFDPLRHAASLVAADTHSVDVGHYEAQYNYFPTRFRPATDLRRQIDPDLTGLEAAPARVRLPGADAVGPDRIDYVLVVDPAPTSAAQRLAALGTDTGLAEHYRWVYRTQPSGLVDVYVRQ